MNYFNKRNIFILAVVVAGFSWLNWWILPNFVVGYIDTVKIMRGWAAVCELLLPLIIVLIIGSALGCYVGRVFQDDVYLKAAEQRVRVAQIEKSKALELIESWKIELVKEMWKVENLKTRVEEKDRHADEKVRYYSEVANEEKRLREEAERKLKKEREVFFDKEKKMTARLLKEKPKKN